MLNRISGTTFPVCLPEAPKPVISSKQPPQPVRTGTGRVLLIDDEESLVYVAKLVIERLGYQVAGFLRAADALDALRTDPSGFDVVVTDQNMPEMNGLEVAQAIAVLRPDLPIVLATGNPLYEDDELAAANVRYHLDKPWTVAALSQVLERALKAG